MDEAPRTELGSTSFLPASFVGSPTKVINVFVPINLEAHRHTHNSASWDCGLCSSKKILKCLVLQNTPLPWLSQMLCSWGSWLEPVFTWSSSCIDTTSEWSIFTPSETATASLLRQSCSPSLLPSKHLPFCFYLTNSLLTIYNVFPSLTSGCSTLPPF